MSTFNRQLVENLLKEYKVQEEDFNNQLFDILTKGNKEAFKELGLIAKKSFDNFWTKMMEIRFQSSKKWIVTRFPVSECQNKDERVYVTIQGPCGSGKTSTVNAICGKGFQSKEGKDSLTREITCCQASVDYKPQFFVIDTPGTSSSTQKLQHAMFLKAALTYKPLNAVFVMVKFNNRFQQFLMELLFQADVVKGYEKKVVFLVSHIDTSKNSEEMISTVNAMFAERQIKNQVVYFSNQNCSKQQLRDTLYKIAKSMPQSQIEISRDHFLKYFNLKRNEKEEKLFSKELKELTNEMREEKEIFKQFALELPNDSQKAEIVQDLAVHLKVNLSEIFKNYTDKNKNTFVGCQYYDNYYTLQSLISELCEQFEKETRSWRTTSYFFSSASGSKDPRDLLKQCPNCGLTWYRVQACPVTTCGNRPSAFWDFIQKTFFRYEIQKVGKKLRIKQKITKQYNRTQEQLSNDQKIKKNLAKTDRLGCGAQMNFDLLPRLENVEEIINTWYQTSNKDEVITIMKETKAQELVASQKAIENKVNAKLEEFDK